MLTDQGRGGNFSKIKRFVAIETRKRLFSGFLAARVGFQKRRNFFPRHTLLINPHKPIYAYLPLFMGSWNMQESWNSDLIWSGDGWICGGFLPLCVLYKSTQTCHFFYCTKELHFFRRIFWAHKIWQLWVLRSYRVFMDPPYAIVTPYSL